jgi:ABC-type transport system involved in cytochrome c biogenesis permease subunit
LSVAFSSVQNPDYVALRDPKVLFSGATWAIFALYLLARCRLGWHGRRSNLVVIYGFVVLAISFFRVPHLFPAS